MLYHRYAWSTTRFKCSFQLTLRSGLATSGKMNMTGRIKCKNRMFVSIYLNIFNRYDVSLMQCQWYMYIYSLPTTITSFYHQGSIKLFMTGNKKLYPKWLCPQNITVQLPRVTSHRYVRWKKRRCGFCVCLLYVVKQKILKLNQPGLQRPSEQAQVGQ